MAEHKEQVTYVFNNFVLKKWLHGDENRRRTLLVKLKSNLRELGLSKQATRTGLLQLVTKPCVIVKRLPVSNYDRKKLLQLLDNKYFVLIHRKQSQSSHRDDVEKKRLEDNSQDIIQHTSNAEISNAAAETTLINAVDVNRRSSSSEVTSLKKRILQNFVYESVNNSLDTTVLMQLKKHSDSKSSIHPMKDDIFERKHKEKTESKIKQKFCSVKNRLLDTSQEDSYESKTYSKVKLTDFIHKTQNVSVLEKSDKLIEHIDTLHQTPIKEDVNKAKICLKSKNFQIENQSVKTNSKTVIKRKIRSESSDRNTSLIKIQKKTEVSVSSKQITDNNRTDNSETSHYKMLSNDELVHITNQTNENIKEGGNSEVLERIRERRRKEKNNNVKKIREKLYKGFRGFDTSKEECKISFNHLENNEQHFDDPLHNDITGEKIEDILKKNKLTYDLSADNWQKDMESAILDKIKSDNLHDSIVSVKEYALHKTVTEKQIKDRSELSCDSDACTENTEKYYSLHNSIIDEETKKEETLVCEHGTSDNNFQENVIKNEKNSISDKVKSSENLDDSSTYKEKYCPMIEQGIKSMAVIVYNCENINVPAEVSSNNSSDSSNFTKKYCATNVTNKNMKNEALICLSDMITNNSWENIENAIPDKAKFDNSQNSVVTIEKCDIATKQKINDELINDESICTLPENSQKNIESTIPFEVIADNSCSSIVDIGKYAKHNTMIDKKKDKTSIYVENVIPDKFDNKLNNLCDFTVNVEKYISTDDITKDEREKNRASICKRNMSTNELENIENVVSVEKQGIQNFLSINDRENSSKRDNSTKHNIPSTIEINLDENIYFNKNTKEKAGTYTEAEETSTQTTLHTLQNQETRNVEGIDSAQHKNMQQDATSNSELLITSTHKSTSHNVDEKDNCDMLENNDENLLLTSNDDIVKDKKINDQLSMITSKLKKYFSEDKSNNFLSISPSKDPSSEVNNSDNYLLDSNSTDDNSGDVEVEIKIKPNTKSRILQKISLKAPWSTVNTYIKNLHRIKDKDNSSFLNEFLQVDCRTSEKSNITNIREKEDSTSLDDNITAEVDKIICDSKSTIKDSENHSEQRNSQDCLILNEDKNMMACNKKDKDECIQSIIQTTSTITENDLGSSKLAHDTFVLGKQLQKINDKQKNNEQQNFRDKTLEETKNVVEYNQDKEVKISSVEKPQITTKNNFESIKAAHDMPNITEQLPQTSSDMTHKKVRVRSIAELSCQCVVNASNPRNVCSAFCQSASQSATVHSMSSQSAVSQSVAPQSVAPQSTASQSAFSQSVSKQPPSSYDALRTLLTNTSSTVAPAETNILNNNNTVLNLVQITIKNICTNIEHCRNLTQYNNLKTHFPKKYLESLNILTKQISKDLEKLKKLLHINDVNNMLVYINYYMPRNCQPFTVLELINYKKICYDYSAQQNYANALQYQNVSEFAPNVSVSNINAQQFLRNARFPCTQMPNHNTFMQSSTMPHPVPSTSNINQQQLVRNSANFTQVPHSKQIRPNIHQSYMSYVPPTAHSRILNANPQPLEKASHPIQGQYTSADMLNIQHGFINMNNISSSNVDMCSHKPVNQGNVNVSSTTNTRQLYTGLQQNTINSTATASAANAQQQKQMYQISQMNSTTTGYPSPITNQNIPLGMCQIVPNCDNVRLPGSSTINPDISRTNVAMGNVRYNTNVNQQQTSCNSQISQTSSGKTQFLPQYDPNKTYSFLSQPAYYNIQMRPIQNTLPNQNMWQVPQQQLVVNQGNTNMPLITNTKQSYVMLNTVSNTTTVNNQFSQRDTSTHLINSSMNNILQNVQQNMSQKLPVNQENTNMSSTISTKQSHVTSKNPINSTTVKSQCVISKATSINSSIDNTLQNVQENVLNKKAEMPDLQNTNRMQKRAQSMNLQKNMYQESIYNKLQNIGFTDSEISTQRLSILQSMVSTISPRKDDAVLFLSKLSIDRKMQTNQVTPFNNLAILTDIQKIVLHDQIKSYFVLWEHKNSLSKQEFERVHNERLVLFNLYLNLGDFIKNMINKSQTVQKSIGISSQDTTSQNKSTLQENTISVDELTKTHLNQDNENSLKCNIILEKQSERSIDLNISKNSKPVTVRSNSEASNEESPCTVMTKKLLPKDTRLQEQDNNTLKKQSPKNSLIDTEKRSQNTKTLSPEEMSITEVSIKNLETKTEDNAINESLKAASLYDSTLSKQSLPNLQDASTENTKDQSEITRNNANNKGFSNTETESVHKTSNIVILNNSKNVTHEEHKTSEFCSGIQVSTNERSNSTESFESFGKLYIDESAENQCDKVSFEENILNKSQNSIEVLDTIKCDSTKVKLFSLLKNTTKADLCNTHQDSEEMQLQDSSSCNIKSVDIIKGHEDITKENEQLLVIKEIMFQKMSLKCEVSKDTLHVKKSMIKSINLDHSEDIEEKRMEINTQELSEDIEKIEIDTLSTIKETNKNREELLKIEEIICQKMLSKFKNSEDMSSIEDNSIRSNYLQFFEDKEEETITIGTQELEDIEKEKTEIDTHSSIKAINEQLKYVCEQKYGKSRTHALNSFQKNDSLNVNEQEDAKMEFLDANDVECISLKSDDSNSIPSILNIRSISPSLYDKIESINVFFKSDTKLTPNDENSLDINDNLGILDEINDKPCLRCKRKSMLHCQTCLQAHYCSERCSSLHWIAEHYKQCTNYNSIICIDD
ncbi:hypothetical protein ALC62_15953 [Cyphomyrmex costatus]|uniref:MYND-type domain-containing protein n=1 Tax=Cyphomyrmex costatus TaxID=456900 RepID=A0A195BZ40_9HYME|nr:hypothetical protein ALC62_15953 [Cyphomyrmex costatus]